MSKRLYVSDLDGTLLTSNQTLSLKTAEGINLLREKDIYFSYATARSFITSQKVTSGINVSLPVIVYNGTFVVDYKSGQILIGNYFHEEIKEVIKKICDHNVHPLVYSYIDGKEYFSFIREKLSKGMKEFLNTRLNDPRWREVDSVEQLLEGNIFYITCIDEKEKLSSLYKQYQNVYHCIYDLDLYSTNQWLEFMPKNVSKASAIMQLKEYLKCDEVIVFGDGKNDIEMFEIADFSYVVSNGSDCLKQIATGIIESNDEDGVIKKLFELEKIK